MPGGIETQFAIGIHGGRIRALLSSTGEGIDNKLPSQSSDTILAWELEHHLLYQGLENQLSIQPYSHYSDSEGWKISSLVSSLILPGRGIRAPSLTSQ